MVTVILANYTVNMATGAEYRMADVALISRDRRRLMQRDADYQQWWAQRVDAAAGVCVGQGGG